ncbi:MAG TPA: glutamate-1-semialdehyde 2,1-aminomutase [Candidatus Limnocylindrales bacterium]|nr:glutamate-1-semialdehyde 2,1-aminomutase [Candidatus Limnocylindrales bacterium]
MAPAVLRQERLRDAALDLFPGGVNSPVRSFGAVGRPPLVLAAGEGATVVDADGRRYVDYIGGWGSGILGHAEPSVVAAVREAAGRGFALGATHPDEVRLGLAIRDAMPSLERLRFTSSGTEAAMSALRLARAATGRELIVKFAGGYHGHVDSLLARAGSGVATLALPGSAGVPLAVAAGTIVLPYNDPTAAALAFAEHAGRIAAVIVEPVAANCGVIPPQPGFLERLRELTAVDGALLIFDEVITGFRLGRGGAQARYRVRPDLTLLGKIIGGGLPVGAYGGRQELMALVAPSGPVYQAGTLAGHPLAMAAGLAALERLDEAAYLALTATADRLADGLEAAVRAAGVAAAVARAGTLLSVFPGLERPPADTEEAEGVDRAAFARLFGALLERGILLPPSPFEAWFVSLAHDEALVDRTIEAFAAALPAAFRA